MIVIVTNRKLPSFDGKDKKIINVEEMGAVLGEIDDQGNRIHCGILQEGGNKIEFYAKGNESHLFDSIPDESKHQPWVFFVHGFHQDPEENIAKARAIHSHHNVNVINFAWPSKPLDKKYKLDEAKKDITRSLIKGVPFKSIASMAGYKLVKGYINDTWDNYEPAIENAEASDVDFLSAIRVVNNEMGLPNAPVLLVHSMGNYLLQNTITKHTKLPAGFNNIILHQADVDSSGYEWVKNLTQNLATREGNAKIESRLYITTNAPDYVLFASFTRRKILGLESAERLGQTQLHYMLGDIHYLDFTCAPGIGNDHEPFKRQRASDYDDTDWNEHIDNNIFDCLGRIFRAEADELPNNNEEVNLGIMKMPTKIHLYRANELIHPADGDHPPEGDLVSPMDMFKDPLSPDEESEETDDDE